jgi:hypothetical protein
VPKDHSHRRNVCPVCKGTKLEVVNKCGGRFGAGYKNTIDHIYCADCGVMLSHIVFEKGEPT